MNTCYPLTPVYTSRMRSVLNAEYWKRKAEEAIASKAEDFPPGLLERAAALVQSMAMLDPHIRYDPQHYEEAAEIHYLLKREDR